MASQRSDAVRHFGLAAGPLAGLLLFLVLPEQYVDENRQVIELGAQARAAASVGLWMATWWMTEAISVYATALLPLAAFPLTGALSIKATAASYGHEIIYLFLGGFVLALALERCGLHRRVAIAALGQVGTRPANIVAAFMMIAAFTSMWVTNTATTIMLLPVALSIIGLAEPAAKDEAAAGVAGNFRICLLLGIAYAATVGGIGTIIGTAPNVFVVSFVKSQMGREISFAEWMTFGVPFMLLFLPLIWWVLTRAIYPVGHAPLPGFDSVVAGLRRELGAMTRAERMTLAIFSATAAAWIGRPLLNGLSLGGARPLAGLTDPGIAVIAALLLFVTPVSLRRGEFLMDWQTAVKLPWGLLVLFGGGLSLAAALDSTGFSAFLGTRAIILEPLPQLAVIALVTALMIFLTELTSNTATTATLVPVLFAIATGLGMDPYLLILPAGIAASCAFMLPVATPPNAIVFGAGTIRISQMTRVGLWLNLCGVALITGLMYAIILPLLGIPT